MPFAEILNPIGKRFGRKTYSEDVADSVIGVEFENEAQRVFTLPSIPGYQFHNEGSLRGFGYEFVLQRPEPLKEAKESILRYFEAIHKAKGPKNELTCSSRTSTHVHFDSTLMNLPQVISFASVYWLLEPLFSEYCGEDRKSNLFCLRMKDATQFSTGLTTAIQQGRPYHSNLFNNESRYGSLNFASLPKFGSLEFRMMRGLSDPKTAINWIEMLHRCRKFSLEHATPKDLHNAFLKKYQADNFHMEVLGKNLGLELEEFLPRNFSVASAIRESFMLLSPLLLSGGDWSFQKEIEKERKRGVNPEDVIFDIDELPDLDREENEAVNRVHERIRRLVIPQPRILVEGDIMGHGEPRINQVQPVQPQPVQPNPEQPVEAPDHWDEDRAVVLPGVWDDPPIDPVNLFFGDL